MTIGAGEQQQHYVTSIPSPPIIVAAHHSQISTTTTQASSASKQMITTTGNWTEFNCQWLDEVYRIQNDFYWQHTSSSLILVLYIIVCSFGALANLLVLIAFARTQQLRNLRNYFIVNLAFSDLMLCCLTAPVTLYLTLNLFWQYGSLTCRIMASIQAVNLFVSCLTLVLIAADRFLLTLCPVKWRLAATAPIICYLVVWLASILVAAPYFFAVSAEEVTMFDPWNSVHTQKMLQVCHRSRPEICIEKTWDRLPFSRRSYVLTVLAIQYVLPLSALGFAYSQIGSTIRKRVKYNTTVDQQRKQMMNKRNRKAMLLLLLLVLIYAVAWLPINLYNVLNVLDIIEFSQYKYIYCHLVGMCSACINPLLYALINDSFRSAFRGILQSLFRPCTKYIVITSGAGSGGGITVVGGGGGRNSCPLRDGGGDSRGTDQLMTMVVDGTNGVSSGRANGHTCTIGKGEPLIVFTPSTPVHENHEGRGDGEERVEQDGSAF